MLRTAAELIWCFFPRNSGPKCYQNNVIFSFFSQSKITPTLIIHYANTSFLLLHYEAKLAILCIVNGFRNRSKSDSVFVVLDSTNKRPKHCTGQNRSKNRQICGFRSCICRIQNSFWNPQQTIRHMYSYIEWLRNPELRAESANC